MSKPLFALLSLVAIAIAGCAPATSAPTGASTATTDAPLATPAPEAAAPAALEVAASATPLAPGGKVVELTPDNTKIDFVGTKPDGRHEGGFKQFAGSMELTSDNTAPAKISVEIQTDSLWSDAEKLTKHLKNVDFFEVEAHPTAKFASTKIVAQASDKGTHAIVGDLTLHGVTKSITVPAKVTAGDEVVLVSDFTISRKEFGMTYGEGKVDDPVQITVAIKAPAK